MRRLCEVAGVNPKTLYHRIELIHDRCREFARVQEAPLFTGKDFDFLHVTMDRQVFPLNSSTSLDTRPSLVIATTSTDARSGYVLAQNPNYDPEADPIALDLLARQVGDPALERPYRKYARLLMPYEYIEELEDSPDDGIGQAQTAFRPATVGGTVQDGVALAAHLLVLKTITQGAKRIQLTMDNEPGLPRLAPYIFGDNFGSGNFDAFVVRIAKDLTQQRKRRFIAAALRDMREEAMKFPGLDDKGLLFKLIEARYMRFRRTTGPDRWVRHPFPTMSEPEREVLPLTDHVREVDRVVSGIARASLRSLDRYFMQLRRKVSILERPLKPASPGAHYAEYTAYSPIVVIRVIEIFRTVYNYHLAGKQGSTPAQRLGLARRQWSLGEILAGKPR